MGKFLNGLASVLEAMGEMSANYQNLNSASDPAKNVTYGDVVRAITKNVTDGFWKNRILDVIPDDAPASKYEAAISVLEDKNSDSFWKKRTLERVFKRP